MTTRLQYIHFSLLGLSAIPIFSTIIIRNNNSGMALSESIQPDWSSIAMLALLSPLGIDLLLDVSRILSSLNLLSFFNTENIEGGRQSFLMIGEMLFVITGMLTSSLLHIMDHSLITYESARVLRCTYVVGATALSFSRVDKLFWPRWIETVVTVSFIASQIFRAYYDAFRSISNPHAQSMLILWITAGSIAAILFYAMGTIWMYKSYIHPYFLRNRIDVAVDDNELMNTASEHGDQVSARSQEGVRPKRLPAFLAAKVSRRILNFRTCENDGNPPHGSQEKLFIAVAILCTTIIFLSSLYEFQSKSYDLAAFIVTDISYILLELSLLLLPMRKAKSDVIHGTNQLLHSRKAMIRYMSHELLNPLNAAAMGLQVLLEHKAIDLDVDLFSTVTDVSNAVTSAVELLESLSSYNNIDCGVFHLKEKHEVHVIPFLDECVYTFAPQAERLGITLSFLTEPSELHSSSCKSNKSSVRTRLNTVENERSLGEEDTILIDRQRIAQVIRTLVANAIKYTSNNKGGDKYSGGGAVLVRATFVRNSKLISLSRKCQSIRNRVSSNRLRKGRSCQIKNQLSENNTPTDNVPAANKMSKVQMGRRRIGSSCSSLEPRQREQGMLRITVADNGRGMSPDVQRTILSDFNPEFLRTGDSTGGSGLGLLIAKGIIDLHNGRISVFSEGEGKGCTFTLDIPMNTISMIHEAPNRKKYRDAAGMRRESLINSSSNHGILPSVINVPEVRSITGMVEGCSANSAKSSSGIHISSGDKLPVKNNDGIRKPAVDVDDSEFNVMKHRSLLLSENNHDGSSNQQDMSGLTKNVGKSVGLRQGLHLEQKGNISFGDQRAIEQCSASGDSCNRRTEDVSTKIVSGAQSQSLSTKRHSIQKKQTRMDEAQLRKRLMRDEVYSDSDKSCSKEAAITTTGNAPNTYIAPFSGEVVDLNSNHQLHNTITASALIHSGHITESLNGNLRDRRRMQRASLSWSSHCRGNISYSATADSAKNQISNHSRSSRRIHSTADLQRRQSSFGAEPMIRTEKTYSGRRPAENNTSMMPDGLVSDCCEESKIGKSYFILVVDDSPLSVKMVKKLLLGGGHTFDEANDGQIAVDKVKESLRQLVEGEDGNRRQYDCILMDFTMPNKDGPTATREIRELGYTAPIYGVTGNTLQSDIDIFMSAGATKVFPKPFVLQKFYATFNETLAEIKDTQSEEKQKS